MPADDRCDRRVVIALRDRRRLALFPARDVFALGVPALRDEVILERVLVRLHAQGTLRRFFQRFLKIVQADLQFLFANVYQRGDMVLREFRLLRNVHFSPLKKERLRGTVSQRSKAINDVDGNIQNGGEKR